MFKGVPGYEGLYRVAKCGCVESVRAGRLMRWRRSHSGKATYASVYLSSGGRRELFLIHRLVMYVFKGASELTVNHKDFNTLNNCLDNLEYMTQGDNIRYSVAAGRFATAHALVGARAVQRALGRYNELGENAFCKLPYLCNDRVFTDAEINHIKSNPEGIQKLADFYNVKPRRIKIIKGK